MGRRLISLRRIIKQYASPTFLVFLALSSILWYVTKLGYTYISDVPVKVNVSGNVFETRCVAEGTGFRLIAYKYFIRHELSVNYGQLEITHQPSDASIGVINPLSLQNAISIHYSDLKIISVGQLPEIKLNK